MSATVFFVGILGVFFGMAFLYLSVKVTGAVAVALNSKQAGSRAAKQANTQTAKKEG